MVFFVDIWSRFRDPKISIIDYAKLLIRVGNIRLHRHCQKSRRIISNSSNSSLIMEQKIINGETENYYLKYLPKNSGVQLSSHTSPKRSI